MNEVHSEAFYLLNIQNMLVVDSHHMAEHTAIHTKH